MVEVNKGPRPRGGIGDERLIMGLERLVGGLSKAFDKAGLSWALGDNR